MKFAVSFLLIAPLAAAYSNDGRLGRDVCAGCHRSIAATQVQTAMSRTWQGRVGKELPANYTAQHVEGSDNPVRYTVRKTTSGLMYEIGMPGQMATDYPVETTVGGTRHGLSFLLRVDKIGDIPLPRAPLVEARYLHYAPKQDLELSPGFPSEKPSTYETAIGRVLTPGFEKKCLSCHGEPTTHGTHQETGVTCESCHGAGQKHLTALARKTADKGILNPAKLPPNEQMQPCAQCHSGFSVVQDPMPDDLLISDQVTAMSNSECWRQSGGRITCTACHDPHQDAPRATLVARSEKTCLGCHAAQMPEHAGLCPINRVSGCVGCHMPESRDKAPFLITDHWIRVHSDEKNEARLPAAGDRGNIAPKHLYLREIVVSTPDQANSLREQLLSGASFFDLARANSQDRPTALNGGFVGDIEADQLKPEWKPALNLQPGELSNIISVRGQYFILQRLPRNFRENAEAHFKKAMSLRQTGALQQSAAELLEALKIYPHFLRALTFLGATYGEAGNPQAGSGILTVATRLYPRDAGAHFNLGIALGALRSEDETAEYQKALEIDPDLILAYLNLGGAFYSKGKYQDAIDIYRRGINVNPLVASLHYSLSLALDQANQKAEAENEMKLAVKIDPSLATH